MGLEKGEQIAGLGVLPGGHYLVLGTSQGQVKRIKAEDVRSSVEASWATIMGLAKGDRVLFAGFGDDAAEAIFFSTSRAIRFSAGAVNPQATPSARGVTGIKLRKGDRLLGGAVIADPAASLGVIVVSKTGYVKQVPLGEVPVQGRGGQGVLLLNQTKATGPVVAAAVGAMDGAVDLIAADGKRQRLGEVPVENRANRGTRLVELDEIAETRVL
jgi:DNA gyrase subunit A